MPEREGEEYILGLLTEAIDLSFTERDPYFREMFMATMMYHKWERVTVLQGGLP